MQFYIQTFLLQFDFLAINDKQYILFSERIKQLKRVPNCNSIKLSCLVVLYKLKTFNCALIFEIYKWIKIIDIYMMILILFLFSLNCIIVLFKHIEKILKIIFQVNSIVFSKLKYFFTLKRQKLIINLHLWGDSRTIAIYWDVVPVVLQSTVM